MFYRSEGHDDDARHLNEATGWKARGLYTPERLAYLRTKFLEAIYADRD
jgi:hypothetical protein